MNYNEKEQWILTEGTWYGIGASFISVGIVFYLKIPIEANSSFWGIVLGVVFIGLGLFSKKKAKDAQASIANA